MSEPDATEDPVVRLHRLRRAPRKLTKARACASLLKPDLERIPPVCEVVQVRGVRITGTSSAGFTELVRASFTWILEAVAEIKRLRLEVDRLEGKVAGLLGELEALRGRGGGT